MDARSLDLLICARCGQQTDRFTDTEYAIPMAERRPCPICLDPRSFVPPEGQDWTTLRQLRDSQRYTNVFTSTPGDASLTSITTSPAFAIGQRAILVQTPKGNILWDCVAYLDDETIRRLNALGGVKHICISHPHFFATCLVWAEAFSATLWINELDKEWLQVKPGPGVRWWRDSAEVLPGYTLVQVGAHFPGSCVLHIKETKAILSADSVMVAPNGLCAILWSFPNMIPASPQDVLGVWKALEPYEFDRIHAGWLGKDILEGGKVKLRKSVEQILRQMGAEKQLKELAGT